jgi:hypothetical protein
MSCLSEGSIFPKPPFSGQVSQKSIPPTGFFSLRYRLKIQIGQPKIKNGLTNFSFLPIMWLTKVDIGTPRSVNPLTA